jgi:hypothetical protein
MVLVAVRTPVCGWRGVIGKQNSNDLSFLTASLACWQLRIQSAKCEMNVRNIPLSWSWYANLNSFSQKNIPNTSPRIL